MILQAAPRALRAGLGAGLLLLASAASVVAQETVSELRCSYTKRMTCTPEGCSEGETGPGYLAIPPLPDLREAITSKAPVWVRRCDDRGCTPVEITTAASAGFLTLSAETGGYLMKVYAGNPIKEVELQTGDFTEVVTSMLMTYVGYGRCAPPQRAR